MLLVVFLRIEVVVIWGEVGGGARRGQFTPSTECLLFPTPVFCFRCHGYSGPYLAWWDAAVTKRGGFFVVTGSVVQLLAAI